MKVKIVSPFGVGIGNGQTAEPGNTPDVPDFLGRALIATKRAEAFQETPMSAVPSTTTKVSASPVPASAPGKA